VQLLFSDIVMPGMTGLELGRKVQSDFPRVKVLLASGYPPPEIGNLTEFEFLSKPFNMGDVARKLRVLAR
jgi:YesN/AraC family two-component response regulator